MKKLAVIVGLMLQLAGCATRGNIQVFDLGLAPPPDADRTLEVRDRKSVV